MSQTTPLPTLTPQLCFSSTALRDFLRLSRATTDDQITQNLNALINPARAGFDPSSTSRRTPRQSPRYIEAKPCKDFKEKILFPAWQARSLVLEYCTKVAANPDPNDPEAAAQLERDRERVIDERLDPYSPTFESRTQRLAAVLRQERGVENIVRTRTWGVMKERCGEHIDRWEGALAEWKKNKVK